MNRSSPSIALGAAAAISAVAFSGCFNLFFPSAPDQFVETVFRANCQFQHRCCAPAERNSSAGRDEATCVEVAFESGGSTTLIGDRAKSAVDRGAATYDAELADRCVKAITDAANSCDAAFFLAGEGRDAECDAGFARGFTVGTVGDGGDCVDSFDCADEGDCIVEAEDDVISTAGECRGRVAEGDDCSEFPCQSGLSCSFAGETPRCEKIELKGDGEECFGSNECESGSCIDGEAGVCFDSGEPCTEDNDCEVDLGDFCDVDFITVCGDAPTVEICDGQ